MHSSAAAALTRPLTLFPAASMFVSEPSPSMFGNPQNPRPAEGWTNGNWLKSRFHFSFAEYHNDARSNFGVLRVLNDDLVQPKRGFGEHPHRDMEICTYILSGELSHKDSLGSRQTLGRGSLQFMTAGTGVQHSEQNLHTSLPVHFLQLWIVPRSRGLRPNYGGTTFPAEKRLDAWHQIVCDVTSTSVTDEMCVRVNQDVNIFVSELSHGVALEFPLGVGRQAYVVCAEGSVEAVGSIGQGAVSMQEADAVEITTAGMDRSLAFTGTAGVGLKSHLLVVEMAAPSA